jgi:hypothetical protein
MIRKASFWFAPKRYGYGAGLPISWEGWLVLAGFIGGAGAAARLLHGPARPAVLALQLVALVLIGQAKTEGGWRWRWGRDR